MTPRFVRIALFSAVAAALAANILWRIPWDSLGRPSQEEVQRAETWNAKNILPKPSNLRAMGRQWKERLATLPPEERKVSEARMKEEVRFFLEARLLPAEERAIKVRERIEALMNDPGIQSDWAAERMRILAATSPEQRRKVLKNYVQFKKQKDQAP